MRRSQSPPPISKRQRVRLAQYAKNRRQRLEEAGWRCEARIVGVCSGQAEHTHHVVSRARGGDDALENLRALCSHCHAYLHLNPAWATANGLLASRLARCPR